MLEKLHVFCGCFLVLLMRVVVLVVVEDGSGIAIEAEVGGGILEPGYDGDSHDEWIEL